jgi:hypothetical protein
LNREIITTFLGLDDTPTSFSGCSGEVPVVNSTENGLVFVSKDTVTRAVVLANGVTASVGKLLALTSAGYVLATNTSLSKTYDVVMALTSGTGTCNVMDFGYYNVAGLTAGLPVYLGITGNYTQVATTKRGTYLKIVGYAINNTTMKFQPDSYTKNI